MAPEPRRPTAAGDRSAGHRGRRFRRLALVGALGLGALAVLAACASAGGSAGSTTSESVAAGPEPIADVLCAADQEPTGPVTDPELLEISGVAASRDQPGVLWVHNDSGSPNVVWALDTDGAVLGRVTVTGAEAVDWEDIAVGAGPTGSVLWVADIGDNLDVRTDDPARIYRVAEPDLATGPTATEAAVGFPVTYADGGRDAEALLADPLTGDLFVLSKQWDMTATGIYRLPADVAQGEPPSVPTVLDRVADLAVAEGALVTGADISPDGTLIAVRTYTGVLLWDREPGRSVAETLAEPPTCTHPSFEGQTEAVAVSADGRSVVTISEGANASLNWLRAPTG